MSATDLPSSFMQADQAYSHPPQSINLSPLQPSEAKAVYVEPQADPLATKENAPYNIKAEVPLVGDQIVRKHGIVSYSRHTQMVQHEPLDGTNNPGYIGDQTYSPSLSGFYYDHRKTSKSHASQGVMRNNTLATMESLPPLVVLEEEIPLLSAGKTPVKFANKVLGHGFAFLTIPFTCFILALHHLIRFILQGVFKPLVIDTLNLIIGNFLRPSVREVFLPMMDILREMAVAVSEFFLEAYRSGIAVLRSIRLIDINITNSHSIQQV